ncbi:hypothetical protein GS461_05085 [Rhodococcus hoagii]|nr:hypothetical protein [Prescottella equi]
MNLSKASKAAAASVLAVAALGTGAGTAYAGTAPGDVSAPLVQPVVDKQTAQDNLLREIGIGWERGGPAAMATGAGVGLAIGCCRSSRTSSPAAFSAPASVPVSAPTTASPGQPERPAGVLRMAQRHTVTSGRVPGERFHDHS